MNKTFAEGNATDVFVVGAATDGGKFTVALGLERDDDILLIVPTGALQELADSTHFYRNHGADSVDNMIANETLEWIEKKLEEANVDYFWGNVISHAIIEKSYYSEG